eukprot:scaffold75374_cov69-Phaeocystis_antarctica.AAC.7
MPAARAEPPEPPLPADQVSATTPAVEWVATTSVTVPELPRALRNPPSWLAAAYVAFTFRIVKVLPDRYANPPSRANALLTVISVRTTSGEPRQLMKPPVMNEKVSTTLMPDMIAVDL